MCLYPYVHAYVCYILCKHVFCSYLWNEKMTLDVKKDISEHVHSGGILNLKMTAPYILLCNKWVLLFLQHMLLR